MAAAEETGNKAPDPYWTTRHGWVIERDDRAPQGDELALDEVGVAAQAARERIDVALERLAHELAESWPSWPSWPADR